MYKLFLLGVGIHGLTGKQKELLHGCGLIVADDRHLPLVDDFLAEKRPMIPLSVAFEAIRARQNFENVAVLASGDPLFFGIGRRLLNSFDKEEIEIHPALSTMQEAAARFRIPWDDMALVSLHGRKCLHPAGLLLQKRKTALFTDKENSPAHLAAQLVKYLELIEAPELLDGCVIHVADRLGTDDEHLFSGTIRETAVMHFSDLNVMIFERPDLGGLNFIALGLQEKEIAHSRGLITKDEVRSVTLHKLGLPRDGVFWDVGAGSGSISVEAARMNPDLTVYAIEKQEAEMKNIKENIRRLAAFNVIPVHGTAPQALQDLPEPDRIFVGGSGGNLADIIKESAAHLAENGRIVVNGVIEKTIKAAPELMHKQGLAVDISNIHVERTGYPPTGKDTLLNPISVMVGRK